MAMGDFLKLTVPDMTLCGDSALVYRVYDKVLTQQETAGHLEGPRNEFVSTAEVSARLVLQRRLQGGTLESSQRWAARRFS